MSAVTSRSQQQSRGFPFKTAQTDSVQIWLSQRWHISRTWQSVLRWQTIPIFLFYCSLCTLLLFDSPCSAYTTGTSRQCSQAPMANGSLSHTTDNIIFCPCPLKMPFYGPLRSHWDSARVLANPLIPRAQLSNATKLFYSVVPCATSFERGSKNKGKLVQPVSSHCLSNTPFHVVRRYLFIFFWRIYIDLLNIADLLICPHHKLLCSVCKKHNTCCLSINVYFSVADLASTGYFNWAKLVINRWQQV